MTKAPTKPSRDWKACKKARNGENIITPKCRLSFPHLLVAAAQGKNKKDGDQKAFSCSLLIPPGCDLTLLKDAAKEAAKEKFGDKMPKGMKSPFLEAGDYEYEGYEDGWTVLRVKSKNRPDVVDAKGNTIDDESDIYPGRWCVASLHAYAYDKDGGRGVAFGLNNVQMLDHDDALGGRRSRAEDDFEEAEGEDGGSAEDSDSIFD